MITVLRDRVYGRLFGAQVIALIGTGLLTIALGLLAYDLAGGDAGIVLGTALTIKMVAYVGVAPIMSALATRMPRKTVLVTADALHGLVALGLPIVTDVWQIYVLIFLLQAASATFTPTFQSAIPDVLPDERQYTRALSLSRLAYDLESLVSPIIAAALLTVVSYNQLFVGTAVGFAGSMLLVLSVHLPARRPTAARPFATRLTQGVQLFWSDRDLRRLLALNLVVAAATAMVVVNSVVIVREALDRPQSDLALLLASYGAGSMVVALIMPKLLDRRPDRAVMGVGAAAVPVGLAVAAVLLLLPPATASWLLLAVTWAVLGAATSAVNTPSARILRRASDDHTRDAVFTAQFSLSHAAFLLAYPLAGTLGAVAGLPAAAAALGGVAIVAVVFAASAKSHRPGATAGLPTSERAV